MSLTRFTTNVNNVQNLADQPTQSASELKVVFDKAGNDIKTYLNSLCTEIESQFMTTGGGTIAGTLTTRAITPSADETYDLGTGSYKWGSISTLTAGFYEGIELFNDSHGTPYIDFHYNGSNYDWTARITETSKGTFTFFKEASTSKYADIVMGNLTVNGYTRISDTFGNGYAMHGYGIDHQYGVFYDANNNLNFFVDGQTVVTIKGGTIIN